MNSLARIFCVLALTPFSAGTTALADSEPVTPQFAECSVGDYYQADWYGDVLLGQTLKIHKTTKEVKVVDEFENHGEDFLAVRVDLHWVSPRSIPSEIILLTSTSAVFANKGVTLLDRTIDIRISCQIKTAQ